MTMKVKKRSRREACVCEVIRRGPNWIVVRVDALHADPALGDRLWRIAREHFVNRLVVEFATVRGGERWLAEPMSDLCSRLEEQGGALRLCGLTERSASAVITRAACPRLHNHSTWRDAVMGGPCCDGDRLADPPNRPR